MSDGTIVAEKAAAGGDMPASEAAGSTGAPDQPAPAGVEREHAQDAPAESAQSDQPEPDVPEPAQPEPAEPAQPEPAEPEPAQPEPAEPEPAEPAEPEPAQPAAAKSSRAGRNLPAALGVGFGLGLSLIAILLFAPRILVGVVAVAIAIATWEVAKRLREADVLVPRIPLLVGGQAMIWLAWPYGTNGVAGAFGLTALVCMAWRLFDHGLSATPRNFLRDTAITIFVLSWIPLLASFAVLMLSEPRGNLRVLTFMILVVCSDVGGYIAGVLFGRHPMVPAISPKKSWEGFAGSLVFCIIGGLLTVTLLLQANSMIGVLLGVAVVLVATCGDLIESQVKRELGIKDMGTLLPGHGGIMDRLDSMLPSAFVSWLVLTALL